MVSQPKLVRIQEKGQVTIPAEVRKRLGLKQGNLVAVTATPEGALITPEEIIATKALNQIGAILKEQGHSLGELIEAGRGERDALLRVLCGIDSTESA